MPMTKNKEGNTHTHTGTQGMKGGGRTGRGGRAGGTGGYAACYLLHVTRALFPSGEEKEEK